VDHNDELLARAARAFPDAVVVPNAGAPGLSGARNTGWRRAAGGTVAFLDDDARAAPSWAAAVAAAMRAPGVVGTGGTISPIWTGGRPRWWPEEFDWVVGCTYRGGPSGVTDVRNVIGASMAFRRDALVEVGGFREELGRVGGGSSGCEETELCIRLHARFPDRRIVHDPRIAVQHRVPERRARLRYFVSRCRGEGLSKADVARLSGAEVGLSTERAYVRRTLPQAVGRNLRQAVRGRDRWGAARAGAIVLGLAATTAGYAQGRLGAW